MKIPQGKKPTGRGKLAGLLVPTLLFCLVVKIALVGLYLYHGPENLSWPPPAQAASDKKGSAAAKEPETAGLALLKELLERKDEQLRLKERELKQKEAALLLLEQGVSTKLAELVTLQEKLTSDLADLQKREKALQDNRIKQLVAVYKAMEPDKAAKLMEKLDESIAVKIVGRMRGRAAGQILSHMEPNRAARISTRLSQTNK